MWRSIVAAGWHWAWLGGLYALDRSSDQYHAKDRSPLWRMQKAIQFGSPAKIESHHTLKITCLVTKMLLIMQKLL